MKLSTVKDLGVLAALLGGAYFVYQKFSGASDKLAVTGEAIGSGLYDLFNPDPLGDTLYYVVHFSNATHSIPASQVDSNGAFTYNGAKFVMRDRTLADGTKQHWAFSA